MRESLFAIPQNFKLFLRSDQYAGYSNHQDHQPQGQAADESKLGFGKIFTDHMFVMDYAPDKGWP